MIHTAVEQPKSIADTACIIILIYARGLHGTIRYTVCALLSENPTSLHISDFEIFAIEIHGVKCAYSKNNFTQILIALINSKTVMEL